MKNHRLVTWLFLGLLVLPGLMGAEETDSTQYMEMPGHYEAIRLALLADSMEGVANHARALAEQASSLRQNVAADLAGVSGHDLEDYLIALGEIESSARQLADFADLESAREEFFVLTRPMAKYRKLAGDEDTIVAYCSMAQKAWIQPEGDIGNPYMGQKMPKCCEVVGEIN